MLQPIQTLAPAPQANMGLGQTDQQVEELKRYIAALRAQRQPVHSAAQGAGNLAADLLGAVGERRINDIQGARQGNADAYVKALAAPGSQPDETSLSAGPADKQSPPAAPAIAATPMAGGDDNLMRIAAVVNNGETGRGRNFDAHSLGNISPDTHGSKSYGFMGLNSKTGSAAEFARRYGPELGITAAPGTAEFDAQWRAASAGKPDAMRAAQMDHFKQTQLQPVYEDLQRWGIPSGVATDPRVQAYFADRHVQMGKLGLQHAAQAWQASGNDPERFLRNMNQLDSSAESLQRYFPNALAQGIYSAQGHATRLAKRLGGALGLGTDNAQATSAPNAPGTTQGPSPPGNADVQPFVQALAGQQTAQAALPPTSQLAQAGGVPGQPGAPQNEFMQHVAALVHMGYTPTQAIPLAQQLVEGRKGFLPQIKINEWGQIVREAPGQVPQYLGTQQGHPGKPATINGVPGFERPSGPNGSIEFHPVDINMGGGARPGGTPTVPTSAPNTSPPATGASAPSPYPVWGDWRSPQDLATYGARMKAAEAGEMERSKKGAELAVVNDPTNQAAALQSATQKTGAEEQAKTDVKYFDTLYKGITGSGTIAAQQKQNIDILRQIADSKDFTPGFGGEVALGLQRLAAQFGINPTGAAPREVFNQIAARVLADQFSGMKSMASETGEAGGRIFKSMLDVEEKANITPQDTLDGIKTKLNLLDRTGDLMMKWADLADDYKAEHGRLDAGFNKQLRAAVAAARLPELLPKKENSPAASAKGAPIYQPAPPPGSVPVPARP